jgi:hypothetical protein
MRKIILISAFLVAFATQAQGDLAYQNTAMEFVKITSMNARFDMAINHLGKNVLSAKKEVFQTEANATLESLYYETANLYMREFTQTELEDLVTFYKTNLGKKLAEKQTIISQKAMLMGVSWGKEVEAIAKKYSAQ